jgi:hypothetical protein
MNQTLHILRKDIRRFRFDVIVLAGITAVFAWTHAAANAPASPVPGSATALAYATAILLTIGWWFLISQVIHEEPLAGDRQFWITRPYQWRHLLAAKLLFVLAFVNLPLLAAQLVILAAAGYQPFADIPALLWMQLAVSVVLLIPAFALGTITRTFSQSVMSILSAIVILYLSLALVLHLGVQGSWTVQAAAVLVILTGAAIIIRLQYSRRLTSASVFLGLCTLLLAGLLCVALPQTALHANVQGISVSIPPSAAVAFGQSQYPGYIDIELPAIISNVPPEEVARPYTTNVSIDGPAGLRWSSGLQFAWVAYPVPTGIAPATEHRNHLYVNRDFYRRIQNTTVTVHGSMVLSLRSQVVVGLSRARPTALPESGFCIVSPAENQDNVFCSSPFRRPYESASGSTNDTDRGAAGIERHNAEQLLSFWDAPWPDFALSPVFVERTSCPLGCEISLVREYPRAWVRRDFTAAVHMPAAPETHP